MPRPHFNSLSPRNAYSSYVASRHTDPMKRRCEVCVSSQPRTASASKLRAFPPQYGVEGMLDKIGIARAVEGIGELLGKADALVELKQGRQAGVRGEGSVGRLDADGQRLEKIEGEQGNRLYTHGGLACRLVFFQPNHTPFNIKVFGSHGGYFARSCSRKVKQFKERLETLPCHVQEPSMIFLADDCFRTTAFFLLKFKPHKRRNVDKPCPFSFASPFTPRLFILPSTVAYHV